MRKLLQGIGLLALAAAITAPICAQSMIDAPQEQLRAFGSAVAIGDSDIFVSETDRSTTGGLVHVFGRGLDGSWKRYATLQAPDGETGDNFGSSLATSGSTLIVGAATAPDSASGAVYIFDRNGQTGGWEATGRLASSDIEYDDRFGVYVALDGDDLAVTASRQGDMQGAVYMYRRSEDGSWTESSKIMPEDLAKNDVFGGALSLKGDHLLIGAATRRSGPGAVYGYHRDADGNWNAVGKMDAPEKMVAGFGTAVELGDDGMAFISAPFLNRGSGGFYTAQFDEGWTLGDAIEGPEGSRGVMGVDLNYADGSLWVGAPGAGAVGSFVMGPDGWVGADTLMSAHGGRRSGFGSAIARKGNLALIAMAGDDNGLGSVAIFEKNMDGEWIESPKIFGESESMQAITGDEVRCNDGDAAGFECSDVDIISFLPVKDIGGGRGIQVNDIWGWTDPETNKEWAIVGRIDGTSFVDISDPGNPLYVGNLPKTEVAPSATWRDMKVYKDHVYIVADGSPQHGMQVFDLRQLRDVTEMPALFEVTTLYDEVSAVHNIVINEDTGFAYAVGSNSGGETCGGGLHMIDIREPANPTFAGCFSDANTGRSGTGYSHDAQCLIYRGPDTEHDGKEICFGSNETALSIADVTDKKNPVALSVGTYPRVAYTHQGWITDDHKTFYVNDELDEMNGLVSNTRTMIWDVTDLDDPVLIKEFLHETEAIDHNLYIKGNLMYQSNYRSGLRIFDITDVENPVPAGHFDTVPYGGNGAQFGGSWSNYPYFKSGVIAVTSMDEGVFFLQKKQVGI